MGILNTVAGTAGVILETEQGKTHRHRVLIDEGLPSERWVMRDFRYDKNEDDSDYYRPDVTNRGKK